MKFAKLTYHSQFPATPVSGRAGARWVAWIATKTESGQFKRPTHVKHPFLTQRNRWCRLSVHFDGIDLQFATPEELDHFIDVLSQNPLPSGRSLVPDCAIGRPNRHWLSRLPAKAKSWKMRQRLCRYLTQCRETADFRAFYQKTPVQYTFPGFYDSFLDAQASQH